MKRQLRTHGLCCVAVAAVLVIGGAVSNESRAAPITIPNGDFETLYKPGTATAGVVSAGGWTQGVGPDCPIDSGEYEFSDLTTGDFADIPGWIGYDRQGWIDNGGTYGRDQTTGNLQGSVAAQGPLNGVHCYVGNGSDWVNPAGALIVSEAPVAAAEANTAYTLSMMTIGGVTPVVLDLLADGAALTPSSSTDPPDAGDWREISRTYDATSLSGHAGKSLTIVLGHGRPATGTQNRYDDVSLSAEPTGGPPGLAGQLGILDLTANGGINPATGNPWQAGDQYRLAFITSEKTTATSPDMNYYNAWVQGLADATTVYDIGAADGAGWKVIGSTSQVDARDNTSTNPNVESGHAIFLLDGSTVVANNYADLWDGSIQHIVDLNEQGQDPFGLGDAFLVWPWTGTMTDGTARTGGSNGDPLGGPGEVGQGNASSTTDWVWRIWTMDPPTYEISVYALSDPLSVRGAAQEGFLHIFKFFDADGDGIQDPGEDLLDPGSFFFEIFDAAGNLLGPFPNCEEIPLPPGVYTGSEILEDGDWYATTPNPFEFEIFAGELYELYVGNNVPEPATLALLGLAACGLGGYVRRRPRA